MEAVDYSTRRGVIVPMMDRIYAVIQENAQMDKMAGLPPPVNIIIWKQQFRRSLTDINNRWLFVLDNAALAGFLFYHFGNNHRYIYLDELMIAWPYRHNGLVFPLLLDKFQFDRQVKSAEAFFAGARIRIEADKEILASVGFKDDFPGGAQPLGTLPEAADTLKLRYVRK